MMTSQEKNERRARIVRRWTAYRVSLAQREIWRRKRVAQVDDLDDSGGEGDLLAELPDSLLD